MATVRRVIVVLELPAPVAMVAAVLTAAADHFPDAVIVPDAAGRLALQILKDVDDTDLHRVARPVFPGDDTVCDPR